MWDIIQAGGVIMALILFTAFVAIVIIIERFLFFRRSKIDEDTLLARLKGALEKGHFDEALSICDANPSSVTNLVKVGIEHRDRDDNTIRELILSAANMEIPKMERFISSLGTIAHVAPLLGLLGTVTGNINAFGVLGEFGAGGDTGALAVGIAEALLTTAAGIIVSIPATMFYNFFVTKVNHTIIRLENRVNDLVVFLRAGRS